MKYEVPWWMSTGLGRWLACRVPFVARCWARNVDRELLRLAEGEARIAKARLAVCAVDFVEGRATRADLVAAVCAYKNAVNYRGRHRRKCA